MILTSFLIFRNNDKLIKLRVILEVKKAVTNFINSLNMKLASEHARLFYFFWIRVNLKHLL